MTLHLSWGKKKFH